MEHKARAEELVGQALAMPPERRQAFLDNSCADLPILREEVEALLAKRSASLEYEHTRALDSSGVPSRGEAPAPRAAFRDSDHFGKYEILGVVGSGGFGVVYKGRDPVLKRTVAVKICTSEKQAVRQRFFREAEIAAGLQHPNITTVHDLGFQNDVPYMVQEFLTGDDLDSLISRQDLRNLVERLEVLQQIGQGLAYAHREGILHRDVKPGNIRVLRNGRVKIMDFGIARPLDDEMHLTSEGIAVGTIGYLAPEQLSGAAADTRVDIFSFGVVAYEVLTGQRPFQGETVSQIAALILHADPKPLCALAPECPEALGGLVHCCLEKDPAQRFATFEEVIEVLEIVSQEVATGSHRLSGAGRFTDTSASRRPSRASSAALGSRSSAGAVFAASGAGQGAAESRRGGLAWAVAGASALALLIAVFALYSWLSRADDPVEVAETPGVERAIPESSPPREGASGATTPPGALDHSSALETRGPGASPAGTDRAGTDRAGTDRVDTDRAGTETDGGRSATDVAGLAPSSGEAAENRTRDVLRAIGPGAEEGGVKEPVVDSADLLEDSTSPPVGGLDAGRGPSTTEEAGAAGTEDRGLSAPPATPVATPVPAEPEGSGSGSTGAEGAVTGPTISPVLLDQPAPVYPRQAMRRRKEAEVVILALVDEGGKVIRTAVKQNSDELGLGFDEAARAAAQEATFEPARRDGRPVQAWSEILYVFKRP